MPGRGEGRHAGAWIEGVACTLDAAIEAALARLRKSRHPLFAGLGCDIEGVRTLVRLARLVGASIDHLSGTATGIELAVARDGGMFLTTPGETGARADTLFILAPEASEEARPFLERLLMTTPKLAPRDAPRNVIWVGKAPAPKARSRHFEITSVPVPPARIAPLLAALRARLAGRPVGTAPLSGPRLEAIVESLRQAKFGVAIGSSAALDPLAIEMLAGLVRDLNERTRFSCLPVMAKDNAAGAAMALTWLTGFPSNIGFARGEAEHDPWRFDAARLARSGEADLALWISAYRHHFPEWASAVPVIALTARAGETHMPRAFIEIEVGTPGVDHDTIDLSSATGGLAFRAATALKETPSVADVLGKICTGLAEEGRAPW
jgi:formylmethanofuran dehydrogenase subunit B